MSYILTPLVVLQNTFTNVMLSFLRYCQGTGLSAPTSDCDAGWYCTLGSWLAQPNYPEGGACVAGEYCPIGSSAPIACDPGYYCHRPMMNETGGLCAPGYYCSLNSTTSK